MAESSSSHTPGYGLAEPVTPPSSHTPGYGLADPVTPPFSHTPGYGLAEPVTPPFSHTPGYGLADPVTPPFSHTPGYGLAEPVTPPFSHTPGYGLAEPAKASPAAPPPPHNHPHPQARATGKHAAGGRQGLRTAPAHHGYTHKIGGERVTEWHIGPNLYAQEGPEGLSFYSVNKDEKGNTFLQGFPGNPTYSHAEGQKLIEQAYKDPAKFATEMQAGQHPPSGVQKVTVSAKAHIPGYAIPDPATPPPAALPNQDTTKILLANNDTTRPKAYGPGMRA